MNLIALVYYVLSLKAVIHQPQFFPYAGFFHKLMMADVFVILDNTQYDKRFTNRNKICTFNDWTWITVPIIKNNKFLPNNKVRINNKITWKEKHLKQLHHSYSNTNFFYLYSNYFKSLYNKDWDLLFDFNFEILKKTLEFLGLKIFLETL